MTYHRNIKALIRERMKEENEPYSVARNHILNKTSSLLTAWDREQIQRLTKDGKKPYERFQFLTKYGERPTKLDLQDFHVNRYHEIKHWLQSTPIYSPLEILMHYSDEMPPADSNMYEYQIAVTENVWHELTGFENEAEREKILELQKEYRESIFSELFESAVGFGHDDDRINMEFNSLVTDARFLTTKNNIKKPDELTLENAAHYLNDCLMEYAKNVEISDKKIIPMQEISYKDVEDMVEDWYSKPMNPTRKLILTPGTEGLYEVEEIAELFDRAFYIDRVEKLELHDLSDYDKELVSVLAKIFRVHKKVEITPFSPVKLVDSIIFEAIQKHASDIHLTPQRNGSIDVKLRINQTLNDHIEINSLVAKSVITRIKVLANLDINETRHAQDSQFTVVFNGKETTIRIATLPTIYGESIVMRLIIFPKEGEPILLNKPFTENQVPEKNLAQIFATPSKGGSGKSIGFPKYNIPGSLENISTEEGIKTLKRIGEVVLEVVQESGNLLAMSKVIYAVAERLNISPNQIHHGINYEIRQGNIEVSSDGQSVLLVK